MLTYITNPCRASKCSQCCKDEETTDFASINFDEPVAHSERVIPLSTFKQAAREDTPPAWWHHNGREDNRGMLAAFAALGEEMRMDKGGIKGQLIKTQYDLQRFKDLSQDDFKEEDESGVTDLPLAQKVLGGGTPFVVRIKKRPELGSLIGIEIDQQQDSGRDTGFGSREKAKTLKIREVLSGTPADEWNASNPYHEILPGDEILEVNGVSGDAYGLLAAIKDFDPLEMTICRKNKSANACGIPLFDIS